MRILSLVLFCGLLLGQAMAQQELAITWKAVPKNFDTERITYEQQIRTTPELTANLEGILTQLQTEGYWSASVDSIFLEEPARYVAQIYVGTPLKWEELDVTQVDANWLSKIGFRERSYRNRRLDYTKIRRLQEDLLRVAEDEGFPFARVQLEKSAQQEEQLRAKLKLDKGTYVAIDTVLVTGDVIISQRYLENYLGIRSDMPYSKTKILNIRKRLRELPFLQAAKDPTVTFYEGRAVVNVYIKQKQASRFDFIVGLLPNTTQSGSVQVRRFALTGDLKGELYNQLGYGEQLLAEVEQLRPATPKLNLAINYPYLFNLPFGVDGKLYLYKQDSSLLDVRFNIGVQYLLEGGNYLKAFWENESSSLLYINEEQLRQRRELPSNLDIRRATFGLEYALQRLDYRFNPRKGWRLLLRAGAGTKRILPNMRILELSDSEFEFQTLYDSLQLKSFQYSAAIQIAQFFPLGKRATLKLSNVSHFLFSQQVIFQNEQFRIGGNRSLRGFDEEAIFATQYTIFTLEPRLLIGTNSYLYAFLDYSWIHDHTNSHKHTDRPLGFGTGLTFETSVGVFGISLAVGRQQGAPLDFRSPKIHLGYVSLF